MKCRTTILLLAFLAQSSAFLRGQSADQPLATSPGAEVLDSRKPIPVADDTTFIEEKSLLLDGALAYPNSDKVEQYRSGYVTSELTSSGRSGLATRSGMTDMESDSNNGIRLYAFVLQPKVELKIKLKSEDSKLTMRFLVPTSPDAFTKEIRRANLPPSPVRRAQISIRNGTPLAAKAVLMLSGPVNYKFRLELLRKVSN